MTTVLVAEDELDARELVADGLRRLGYRTLVASNGEEAVAKLDSAEVLVTDLVMPRLDGIGLLKRVRERRLNLVSIIITSFADKERAVAALNLGASYLIEKPFTVAQIHEVIQRQLSYRSEAVDVSAMACGRLAELELSERERAMILFVLKGLPNRDIATQLAVSEQAVKNYLHQLYRKLGISSRGELFHLIFPV